MSLLFKVFTFLAPIFDSVTCIIATDDAMQILVTTVSPSTVLLQWSETVSRVPAWTLLVVKLMTPCFGIMVECSVNYGCYVQHCLEALSHVH
jgi:TRAP-type C4-dicarboxylate transport system permease large subunit